MYGLCFVCAKKCTHSFVSCNECGLSFHSECLSNKAVLDKKNLRFEMPCKIQYQETALYPLEQCQVCEQLEELSRWKEKIFVKELVKTIDLWYENCEDVASQGDKTTLLYEKCDIEDVLSSKKIKEEFLKGPARSTKLITSTGTKDFPVYEISEMKEMINENRISLRDFILQLWCWITAIRSLGENGKASLIYAHLCNEQLVPVVKTHLQNYLACPTHYTSMNEDYISWKEVFDGGSAEKDRFPLCKPPHKFGWLDNTKLVFILKLHQEIDGLKVECQDVFQDEFKIEDRERIPIENIQKPTHVQIIDAMPQYCKDSTYFHKKEKRRKRTPATSVAGRQYIEAYKEYLKKLESDGYEMEELMFDPEEHQRKSKSVLTQTYSDDDWQSDNVQENIEVKEGALEEFKKNTNIKQDEIKRKNEKENQPKCTICITKYIPINQKMVNNGKKFKPASPAIYFSHKFQWFSCEGCYATLGNFHEEDMNASCDSFKMQFKNGPSIAQTFAPIKELRKVFKS